MLLSIALKCCFLLFVVTLCCLLLLFVVFVCCLFLLYVVSAAINHFLLFYKLANVATEIGNYNISNQYTNVRHSLTDV